MTKNPTPSFANRTAVAGNEPKGTSRNLKDVADGTVLVGQTRQVFDHGEQSAVIVDVELLSVEWVFQFSIENESKGERKKEMQTEIGMTVTSGKEVSDSVSAKAGFSGWGFSAEVNASTQTKTFTSVETSNKTTVTDTYSVPPESSIFVYKKKFKFRCVSWVYWASQDAWLETKDGKKIEAEFVNEIIANEELISPVELANHGRITNNPPSGLVQPTKGYSLSGGIELIWYTVLTKMYPWLPSM